MFGMDFCGVGDYKCKCDSGVVDVESDFGVKLLCFEFGDELEVGIDG